jgi:hypothetical protein
MSALVWLDISDALEVKLSAELFSFGQTDAQRKKHIAFVFQAPFIIPKESILNPCRECQLLGKATWYLRLTSNSALRL